MENQNKRNNSNLPVNFLAPDIKSFSQFNCQGIGLFQVFSDDDWLQHFEFILIRSYVTFFLLFESFVKS